MTAEREMALIAGYESPHRRRQDARHDRGWLAEWDAVDAGRAPYVGARR